MEAERHISTLMNVCLRIKAQKSNSSDTDSTYSVLEDKSLCVKSWRGEDIYKFTHIFNEASTQEEVYDYTTREAVNSFLQGNDCLIFAYGTTNAGKTYSVQGNVSQPGIVPRAMRSIFSSVKGHIDLSPHIYPANYASAFIASQKDRRQVAISKSQILSHGHTLPLRVVPSLFVPQLANCSLSFSSALSSTVSTDLETTQADVHGDLMEQFGWSATTRCSLWISMVEVYNEQVFDLLSGNSSQKVSISTDADGRFYPCGNTEVNVNNLEEAKAVIQFGTRQRKHCATLLNVSSSRSHSVLRLRLVRADRAPMNSMQLGPQSPAAFDVDDSNVSTFMFCDLAGSERVNKAGNVGSRARETANINTSLVVLGRCIEALRLKGGTGTLNRSTVVPFRDSKLTKILQPLLSAPGIKNLLVNMSKSPDLLDETINVLKFSAVARIVKEQKVRPLYQHPTQSKLQQLHESYRVKANLEETRSNSLLDGTLANVPRNAATQTEILEEIIVVSDSDDNGTPTGYRSKSDDITTLKMKCYETRISELQTMLAEKEEAWKQREEYLFASFETLEQELKNDHNEELDNKETQLYNLMEERIEIQKKYFEAELVKKEAELVKKEADTKVLTDKLSENNNELTMAKQDLQAEKLAKLLLLEEKEKLCNISTQYELNIEQLKIQLEVKRDMLDISSDNLQKERQKSSQLSSDLYSKCQELQNMSNTSSLQVKDNTDEIASLNNEIKSLQLELKHLLKQKEEMRVAFERDEKRAMKYKKKCTELAQKLTDTESNLQHLQQVSQYLIDEFRPDLRNSITCADHESAWTQILDELKTIPSQCALLKQENMKLTEELKIKDQDIENFKKRRDEIVGRYEKDLKMMSLEVELHKRESQSLAMKMLCMTPRRAPETTPNKEFKTPLTPRQLQSVFTPIHNASIKSDGEESGKKSSRRKTTKKTPAKDMKKENIPHLPPLETESEPETPGPKQRNRRKLYNHHPAVDDDEPPVDCDVPQEDQVAQTKRKLRSKYKY